ncbi:MAG TPA: DNA primase [Clostridia bacterium]|nr:DNA primase [Clostridia bacterium]
MIPESFIEELKYRSDIEQIVSRYTNLKRSGRNLSGICPFHSEKTPSFVVYPENNSFYCFGCGAGGDVVTFVRMAEHLEYIEALRFLADKAGISLPDEVENDGTARLKMRMLELNRQAARFFNNLLNSAEGKRGMDYFQARGLSLNTIRKFGLGYAPDSWDALKNDLLKKGFTEAEMAAAAVIRKNDTGGSYDQFRDRVMFPIIDLRGGVIGFGGRVLGDGRPKYLNSSDTVVFKKSRGLFAMNFAKATKRQQFILCEGYMDAIAIHQAGFDNAVATLGTALTPEQARLIAQYTSEVVISYDSDVAGQKATQRASQLFSQTGVTVRVLSMSGAKDPDEYIKKYGTARFSQLIEGSANATEYQIMRLKDRFALDTDDGKVGFLKEFCALMAQLRSGIEADIYTTRIASELGVSREAIAQQTAALRKKAMRQQEKKYDASLKIYAQELPNQKHDPQRAANLRYALAEDKLIAALMKNPDYAKTVSEKIAPAHFVTDSNRDIFSVLINRLLDGRNVDMMSLSAQLSIAQMNWLSHLLATNREHGFTLNDTLDYIEVIKEKQQLRTNEQVGSMNEDELKAFINGIVAKKNPIKK